MNARLTTSVLLICAGFVCSPQTALGQNGTSPGSVDLQFTAHTNAFASSLTHLVPRPSGGFLASSGSQLLVLTTNADMDTSFQSSSLNGVGSFYVSPLADGRVYAADGSGVLRRLLANGTLDTTFNINFTLTGANGLVVPQTDGKFLVGAVSATFNGFTKTGIARVNANGSLDTDFHYAGTGISNGVGYIEVMPDGKILVGPVRSVNGVATSAIARLNADGTLDPSYTSAGVSGGSVVRVLKSPGGKLVLTGRFTNVGGLNTTNLARLNSDGSVDSSFTAAPIQAVAPAQTINAIVIQPDGKVLVGGSFTNVGGLDRNGIARLNSDGSVDASFNPGAGLARYNPSAGMDEAGVPFLLAQQPDGKILVSGSFYLVNGVRRDGFARLHGDGGLVVSQTTNSGSVILSVTPGGSGTTYQWQLNGASLSGATNASFTVTNVGAASAGRYSVIVSSGTGVAVSQPANVHFFGEMQMVAATTLAGSVGQQFRVDYSDVVTVGTTNWLTLTNVTLPYSPFLVIDPASSGKTQRYYRAVPLP